MISEFFPKLFLCLRQGYSFSSFRKDLLAGITVGIIALPLAMAFGIASGVTPERGLFTAIIAGFLISTLGGSRVQIGGPTGAFVVIVYEIVQRNGVEGLALATLIAAIILVAMGFCRFGSWIKFVPHPLITGFTTGIAVLIFSSQMKDFFGLQMGVPPSDFLSKWTAYFHALPTLNWLNFGFSAAVLGFILFIRKFFPKIPWGISAIVVATAASFFFHLPLETIQTKFGQIPNHLPLPSFPHFSFEHIQMSELFIDAITIALLGGIESLLSAVVADGMIGGEHKSNCELVAQGLANFGSVLFGGIPATGAIARTAANVKSGGRTPVAGIIHALTLLFILLFLSPIVSLIPLSALAAILVVIAWNMSEAHHFFHLLRAPASDVAILLTAFLLTVFVDITVAILVGMILASFIFMKRMSLLANTVPMTSFFRKEIPESDPDAISKRTVPAGVEVYEVQGPFFFGATDILKRVVHDPATKILILRMRNVPFVDASGMHALVEFHQRCLRANTKLLLSGIHGHTKKDLERFGLTKLIGKEHIFPHIDAALAGAAVLLK